MTTRTDHLDREPEEESMRALVVFESMYGNTARIAEAIGRGIGESGMDVAVTSIDEVGATHAAEADLLVVGGPTHAHGMSRAGTRATARNDEKNTYEAPTVGPGLRPWFSALVEGGARLSAAFDTRLQGPKALTGSAAKGIARRLEQRGSRGVAEPESFLITKQGTLVEGEIERAHRWGREIAARAARASAGNPRGGAGRV